MQYADYVVYGVLIDGYAGEGGAHYKLHILLKGIVYVYGGHIHPGSDYLIGQHIIKIQGALKQVAPVLIKDALVLNGFYNGFELILGNGGNILNLVGPELFNELHYCHYDLAHGRKNEHKEAKRQRHKGGEGIAYLCGDYLWRYLAKGDYQHRHYKCGRPCAAFSQQVNGYYRGNGGGGDIHKVVAYQYGGKGGIEIQRNAKGDLVPASVCGFRSMPEANDIGRGIGDFRAGEKRGKGQQYYYKYVIKHGRLLPAGDRPRRISRLQALPVCPLQ